MTWAIAIDIMLLASSLFLIWLWRTDHADLAENIDSLAAEVDELTALVIDLESGLHIEVGYARSLARRIANLEIASFTPRSDTPTPPSVSASGDVSAANMGQH